MSKLLEDEKVAKLVDRERTKATKAERKRVTDLIKEAKEDNKATEDKAAKKAVAAVLKDMNSAVRYPPEEQDDE